MTLNTHSLEEEDYEAKLHAFAEGVCRADPDIIALQEVNQTQTAAPVDNKELELYGYVPCAPCTPHPPYVPCASASPCSSHPSPIPRMDNHAYRAVRICAEHGRPYHWTWIGAKTGYGKYDEGLAILSRIPIAETKQFYITASQDYANWKTRRILGIGIATEHGMEYFYSVHMGWWKDEDEPFEGQWERIRRELGGGACLETYPGPVPGPVWLMGDFNSPAHVRGEGRDLIRGFGWLDSYELARSKDSGITVGHAIDGWREQGDVSGMRIDYIWTSRKVPVRSSRVIFNGSCEPIVSDHYGIIVEYEPGHHCP